MACWPRWSKDGTRIIHVTDDRHFIEVSWRLPTEYVVPANQVSCSVQRQDTPGWHSFAFDSARERFLLAVATNQRSASMPLTVVLNWMSEIAKR